MEKIRNAYPSEEKRLRQRDKEYMFFMMELMDLCDVHGYELEAVLENGMPLIVAIKSE